MKISSFDIENASSISKKFFKIEACFIELIIPDEARKFFDPVEKFRKLYKNDLSGNESKT